EAGACRAPAGRFVARFAARTRRRRQLVLDGRRRRRAVAQPRAALPGEVAQMACVVAQQIALDVAARVEVVRAGTRWAGVGPELEVEEARWGWLRAVAGALLAHGRQQDRTRVAIFAPLGEQPDGAAPGEGVQAAFGGRVAVAGGGVEAAGVRAGRADRPRPAGPAMRLVAPGAHVARRDGGAKQQAGRRAMLAERVLHDLQPEFPVAAARRGRRLRRQRPDAGGARVRAGGDEAPVEPDETGGQPAEHASRAIGGAPGAAPGGRQARVRIGLWSPGSRRCRFGRGFEAGVGRGGAGVGLRRAAAALLMGSADLLPE